MDIGAETVETMDTHVNGEAVTDGSTERNSSTDACIGRVRWTICAMLFGATSINYMDRQVIAILKPTLRYVVSAAEGS